MSAGDPEIPLTGENMSTVVRSGHAVKRTSTAASETIQQFLAHLRHQGIDWVPEPLGFDDVGREKLSFIEGNSVDGAPPAWFWKEHLLIDIASRLRQLHDASMSFAVSSAVWNWEPMSPPEVILHRDFAPYNCIFRDENFVGLIDFDLCAPGPRILDIAYTTYRFVPLMPFGEADSWSTSPFDESGMRERLQAFLAAYSLGDQRLQYSVADVLSTTVIRLDSMVEWINERENLSPNSGLLDNVITYAEHRQWLAHIAP